MSDLYGWLVSSGLENHYRAFQDYGVNESNFIELQFQDYDAMGILDAPSRQKLFRLIQNIKREQANKPNITKPTQPQPTQSQSQSNASGRSNVNNSNSSNNASGIAITGTAVSKVNSQQQSNSSANNSRQQVQTRPAILAPLQPQQSILNNNISNNNNFPDYFEEDGLLDPIQPPPTTQPILQQQSSKSTVTTTSNARKSVHQPEIHSDSTSQSQQPTANSRRQTVSDQPPPSQQLVQQTSKSNNNNDEEEEYEQVDEDDDTVDDSSTVSSTNENGEKESKIRVAVRKRPINTKEKQKGELDIASVHKTQSSVVIHEPKMKVDLTKYVESHKFVFDEVFHEEATNEEIYNVTCKPLISFFMNKGKATCFAYGQTGSGKTFTMMGPGASDTSTNCGLYILAARDIFKLHASNPALYGDLQVWVSFFEIYGGKLFDLLNERGKLICREDGQKAVNIVGLVEKQCVDVNDLLECISSGNAVRSTGSTGANVDSSRSHAILQVTLKKKVKLPGQKPKLKIHGKFSFIDLAGSERAADTSNNDRRTRLEGAEINKSLLALKECIRALDQGGKHLPFRGSQLTQVLKDSFMGNSRTIMIANISPNSGSCEHTLNTLRYADRVKELKKGEKGGKGAQFDAYMPHRGNMANRVQNAEDVDLEEVIAEAKAESKSNNNPQPLQPAAIPSKLPQPATSIPTSQPSVASGSSSSVASTKPSGLKKPTTNIPTLSGNANNKPSSKSNASNANNNNNNKADLEATQMDLLFQINAEQEALLDAHRAEIDLTMKSVKAEMDLLKKQDNDSIEIDQYADKLDEILNNKLQAIIELRNKLTTFRQNLQEESQLTSSLQRSRNAALTNEQDSNEEYSNEFDNNTNNNNPSAQQSRLPPPNYTNRR